MEMKKIMALSMLLIFLMSAFSVFAQEVRTEANTQASVRANAGSANADAEQNASVNARISLRDRLLEINERHRAKLESLTDAQVEKLESLNKTQLEVLSILGRARMNAIVNSGNAPMALAKLEVRTFATKADMFRERVVENFQGIRAGIESLREEHAEIRAELSEERAEFRAAVEAGNEEDAIAHAKAYLIRVADIIINNLEKIKAHVEENDDLTEEEAANITADIDAKIELMTEAKADVEAAETKEEVKAAGAAITEAWHSMRFGLRLHADALLRLKVTDILKRAEYLENKFESALARLEEEGHDVSDANALLDSYSEAVAEARVELREAHSLLVEAYASEDSEEMVEQAKELISQAHEHLREAHDFSKQIIAEIREISGSIDIVLEESSDAYVLVEEGEA